MGSKSGRALKEGLVAKGIRCFRKKATSGFIPTSRDLIVYYGGTDKLQPYKFHALNNTRDIAQNKLHAFRAFATAKLSTVEWTDNNTTALEWFTDQQQIVMARTTLTGHSGQGIVVCDPKERGLVYAPLYTKYQKKTYECRVHVFNGKVIDAQIKRKKTGDTNTTTDTYVRNIHTGWVYCREDFTLPDAANVLAVEAVRALGLDFGAVDLIYNKHHNQFYLLEVNTAPGLEGTTLTNYIKEIVNVCKTN